MYIDTSAMLYTHCYQVQIPFNHNLASIVRSYIFQERNQLRNYISPSTTRIRFPRSHDGHFLVKFRIRLENES